MLITECRHCGARFRATPDQLNMRQGQVRCGQCQQVFNAFESIVRVPAEIGQALPQAASVPSASASPTSETTFPESSSGDNSPAGPEDPLGPAAAGEAIPLPQEEGPAAAPGGAARIAPDLESIALPRPSRLPRAWSLGVLLLALVLSMQLAYAFRAQLSRNYPGLRPVLESLCAAAGCKVPWVNDEAALRLEDSEMLEVPGKPGQIALQARIRNLASSAQEYPHLELTLTDINGQAAIRRVLRPADYLGRGPEAGEVMAAGSEALLSVRLETGRIRVTGSELLLFDP